MGYNAFAMKKPVAFFVCLLVCLALLAPAYACAGGGRGANVQPVVVTLAPAASPLLSPTLSPSPSLSPTPSPAPSPTLSPAPAPTAAPAPTPFSLLWLSDTQTMSFRSPLSLLKMGEWVAENRAQYNILEVVSTGDAVEHGANPRQWANYDAMRAYFADLPYFGIAGNHELGVREKDYAWYLARPDVLSLPPETVFEGGRAAYRLFSAGGVDFIVLGVGWLSEEDALDWANGVLETYRDRTAILLFHGVIDSAGRNLKIGKFIVQNYVMPNTNVRLVLCGHVPGSFTRVDEYDLDGDGDADHRAILSMYNYQTVGERNGQLRILTFDPAARTLAITTYSPVTEVFYRENGARTPVLVLENAF